MVANENRPNPDLLLNRIRGEAAKVGRGRLKIFFGASAGVGKTYAMLGAARQQLLQGLDVVIGVVETHGRLETEVMADGIERLPLKEIDYRQRLLKEFDLEAALARKPDLILVDELGFAPLDDTGAQLLFRFVAASYERRSLGLASHWPFESWGRFLPEHTTAVSMLDRLLHHCHTVVTNGDSYRMRQARTTGGTRLKTS